MLFSSNEKEGTIDHTTTWMEIKITMPKKKPAYAYFIHINFFEIQVNYNDSGCLGMGVR
jgi:hypothetical protein